MVVVVVVLRYSSAVAIEGAILARCFCISVFIVSVSGLGVKFQAGRLRCSPEQIGTGGIKCVGLADMKPTFDSFDFPIVPIAGVNLAFLHCQFKRGEADSGPFVDSKQFRGFDSVVHGG
jgi:hypothetical protein